jgi:hypothetical protein
MASGFDHFAFLRAIRDDKRLGVVEKAVAGISLLGRRNQDTAQCDPSLATICADAGVKDERTVVKAIEALVQFGHVHVVKARGQRNKYVLVNREVPASDVPTLEVPASKVPTSNVPTFDATTSEVPTSNATRVPTSDAGTPPTSDVGRRNQIRNQIRNNKRATKVALNFYGVSEQIVEDWKANRKAKRAVISQSVIDGLKKKADEARRLGHPEWNLEAIMREQVARAWQGFELSWVLKKDEKPQLPPLELTPEAKARRRAEALRAQRQDEEGDQPGVFEDLVGQVWEEVRRAPG